MEYLTLTQLAGIIKAAVTTRTSDYWVTAEIAQMSINDRSGHCYLELVDKDDGRLTAQLRATVWATTFSRIRASFREGAGMDLAPGIRVLMLGRVTYHEVYGLSFNVLDIDAAYTLGEMALARRRTIERLEKEGLIGRNRSLAFPLVPQRIAVVSSRTAAGYGDFLSRVLNNPYGIAFGVKLFDAYMQGERAEASMLDALGRLRRQARRFDLAVVIRGGGSRSELHPFDSYGLARAVALFPMPVLTGIGHERDETVLDTVSHTRLITPTSAADHIVSRARDFDELVDSLADSVARRATEILSAGKGSLRLQASMVVSSSRRHLVAAGHRLSYASKGFEHSCLSALAGASGRLRGSASSLRFGAQRCLSGASARLGDRQTRVTLLDPANVLSRGYSITRHGGRAVRDPSGLKSGDIISTRLHRGNITSEVKRTEGPDGGQEEILIQERGGRAGRDSL